MVELFAWDPASTVSKARREIVEELVELAKQHLGGEWRLISSSRKLRKIFFEADFDGRRVIGKISRSAKAKSAFGNLTTLWEAGMRPPQRYTVVEPIAWLPERSLLIQEKAQGLSLLEVVKEKGDLPSSFRDAGAWLKALWASKALSNIAGFDCKDFEDKMKGLAALIRTDQPLQLERRVSALLKNKAGQLTPSHGDFHPMNVYVSDTRMTAIDLDTFALREKEADVGYFAAQTAIFGLHVFGSFHSTRELRRVFLDECGPVNDAWVAAYMAWTLLRSLHYDLCILKIENPFVKPMLSATEHLLSAGTVDLPS
jgi:hypothetical protein